MAKILVKWFKEDSGKYYTSGLVEVHDFMIWQPEFKQAIVNNQNALVDSWVDHSENWYVITDSTPEQDADPNFQGFYTQLFKPGAFKGLKKESNHEKIQVRIPDQDLVNSDKPEAYTIDKLRKARIPISPLAHDVVHGRLIRLSDPLTNNTVFIWEGNEEDLLPVFNSKGETNC